MPHVAELSVRDLEAIRVLASPGNAWRDLDARSRVSRRLERPSGRSSVMSWGIVPGSGPYWECDPMVRVLRNVLIELCPRRARRSMRSIERHRAARALSTAATVVRRWRCALAPCFCAGCQSFSSPLAQWRAAYDGGLIKGRSKEEMADASGSADSQNLFDRWITPRASTGRGPTRRLGAFNARSWAPTAGGRSPRLPRTPRRMPNSKAAKKLFEQGNSRRPRKQFAKIAKDRKGTPWGETAQYYLAESQFQRGKYVDAHDNFEKLHDDLSRHRLPRQAGQPRVRHRPALEPSRRSQGTQGQTASLVQTIRRRFADH